MKRLTLLFLIIALGAPPALANFDQGLAAYEAGEYAEAIEAFETSLASRETAAVRHNLALAYFQNGEPGKAVWQLERARLLEPRNESYLFKLGALRQQLGLPLSRPGWAELAGNFLSRQSWVLLGAASFWLGLGCWLIPRSAGWRYHLPIKGLLLLALCGVTLSGFALYQTKDLGRRGISLVTAPTELRAAPASAAPQTGILRPGERASLVENHRTFSRVQTEGGAEGWVRADQFRLLL